MEHYIPTGGLNKAEEADLIRLLHKVKQPWSEALHKALEPLIVFTRVYVVCLFTEGKICKVLLVPRQKSDLSDNERLHVPRTVLRQTDSDYFQAVRRVLKEHIGGISLPPYHVRHDGMIYTASMSEKTNTNVNLSPHAVETPQIYGIAVNANQANWIMANVKGSVFRRVNNLPSSMLVYHRWIVAEAVDASREA